MLQHVLDGGLAACLLIVPFLMGARHPIGQVALVALTSASVIAWALKGALLGQGAWRPTYASWILGLGALLVVLQLAPLSGTWLTRLSPHSAALLASWSSDPEVGTGIGVWSHISLTPAETRAGLILFLSYSALFLVTVQRIKQVEDIERVLRWCALAAILMAVFGLVQYFASNGRFWWIYQSPYTTTDGCVKGSFTNPNHFAHFLALGIGPLVWWMHSLIQHSGAGQLRALSNRFGRVNRQTAAKFILATAMVVVVFAGLLSLSRGGIVVLWLAGAVAAVICGRAAAVRGQFLAGLLFVTLMVVVSLNLFGYRMVSDQMASLSSGSMEELDQDAGRRTIWIATLRAIPKFGCFGSGVGSFREVYPVFGRCGVEHRFQSHAENGPLQVALETGFLGAFLLACGIGFCAFWCIAGLRRAGSARLRACLGAIAASLTASLVHSLADFVWYVPACTAMVAVLAALACRAWQLTRPADDSTRLWAVTPGVAVMIAVAVAAVSVGMVQNRYRAAMAQQYWESSRITLQAKPHFPPQQDVSTAPETQQALIDFQRTLIADLERAVHWCPDHARARMSLARRHLRLFELYQLTADNPFPLSQVRDAVIASQAHFKSRQERDEWMQRAFGSHCQHLHLSLLHAKQGLHSCPLLGDGYVFMSKLCFLDRAASQAKWTHLQQAIHVRPYSGYVWEEAAKETATAVAAGDLKPWLRFAREVMQSGTAEQKRSFLRGPLDSIPPEAVGAMLKFYVDELPVDPKTLGSLYAIGKSRGPNTDLKAFQSHYARVAEAEAEDATGLKAVHYWKIAAGVHHDMKQFEDAIRCLRRAVKRRASDANGRYRLACLLLQKGDVAEAREHLEWCARRNPDNKLYVKKYQESLAKNARKEPNTARRQSFPTR